MLGLWLSEYNFNNHVASDIGIEENFIDPRNLTTQESLDTIASWTDKNLMKINEKKSN